MSSFWFYLLAGCFLIGGATGTHIKRCPNEDITMVEVAAGVAVWPAVVMAVLTGNPPDKECKK